MTPAAPLAVVAAAPSSPHVRGAPGLPIFATPAEMQTGESRDIYPRNALAGFRLSHFQAFSPSGSASF